MERMDEVQVPFATIGLVLSVEDALTINAAPLTTE
jgi:hypothetical protein